MLKKFLNDVIVIVVGKHAEPIADLLDSNKYVNEFILAKKLDITINQTRNILYKIADHGLVSSIRKKDKKKGWYTYFWKFEVLKCLEFLRGILLKRINQLEAQIESRKTKEFYICERCNIETSEEHALLYDFTCNECGEIFVLRDNTKILNEFNKSLNKLNNELGLIDAEIDNEKQKREKIKAKEIKKEENEKAKKRAAKKKATLKKKKSEKPKKSAKSKISEKKSKKKSIKKKTSVKKKKSEKSKKKVTKRKSKK